MITAMTEFLTEASRAYDIGMMKIEAVSRSSERQLAINYKEAEYKVLTESGTDSDLSYLREEADASFVERTKAILIKMKDKILEFLRSIQEKIADIISSAKYKLGMSKAEKRVKLNPLLGKKKMTVEDSDETEKVCNDYISRLKKLFSKNKSGATVTADDVDDVDDSFSRVIARAGSAAKATITTDVSNAIKFCKDSMSKVHTHTKNLTATVTEYFGNAVSSVSANMSSAQAAVSTKISALISKISKWSAAEAFNSFKANLSNILRITKSDDETKDDDVTAESVTDPTFQMDEWERVINNMDVLDKSFDIPAVSATAETCKTEGVSTFESLMREIDDLI